MVQASICEGAAASLSRFKLSRVISAYFYRHAECS